MPAASALSPRRTSKAVTLRYYGCSIGISTLLLLLYRVHPYFTRTLQPATQHALLALYIGYLLVFLRAPRHGDVSKSKLLLAGDLCAGLPHRLRQTLWGPQPAYRGAGALDPETRTALLSLVVKAFYLPLMLNFFFGHLNGLALVLRRWPLPPGISVTGCILDLLFEAIFLLDTTIFVFGYAVESDRLGNRIRSVEPTLLGWTVALACYPPFNDAVSQYLPTEGSQLFLFHNPALLTFFRLIAVLLYLIYVWASVALGTRASNLTHRGIVARGPYAHVRHPAYIAKNLAWWFEKLPWMSTPLHALALLAWNLIYLLRALTEERHLARDPEYVRYCEKVPYRFIPGVF